MNTDALVILILAAVAVFVTALSLVAAILFFMNREKKLKAQFVPIVRQRDALQKSLAQTEHMSFHELKDAIAKLEETRDGIKAENAKLEQDLIQKKRAFEYQISKHKSELEDKKKQIVILDEEILLQSFGFYTPRYNLQNSEMYKARLEQIREKQSSMVKGGKAAFASTQWVVNNNEREGERVLKDFIKLILRSFNNECDASIVSVKFNNVSAIEKKIKKAFDVLNELGKRMSISLAQEYLSLKLEELYLSHEYQVKKQDEKEEQKRLREQLREEAKLMKEIEDMKLKLGKEERHFQKALEVLDAQLQRATSDAERQLMLNEQENIRQNLCELEKNKQDILNREQNTRAGYVYIISNIGSFGENVYKIGVTRRLDPQERVDELGDASVPFEFDVHALIFSEDAPALEYALHKAFEQRRLNMINRRREFFNVTLAEIEKVVKTNFKRPVEIMEFADAPQYRQSLKLKHGLAS